jgi:cytochrome c oxidase subunit II
MGKWFAILLVIVALVSAYPILFHQYEPPQSISTDGQAIDRELDGTMAEAGIIFLLAQFVLAFFIWKFTGRAAGAKPSRLPGGAKLMVAAAFVLVGVELIVLGVSGQRTWASVYLTTPKADALQIQAQAGQFAFYFRYPGADGKFGPLHADKIDDANANFFGLDPEHDVDSRDDIISGELVIPVNKEILLLMHTKDVGHSFYVRELRIQQDFVPGLDLSLHFTADTVGRYEIVCTQLCGMSHYNMKAYLNVMSQENFEKWLKQKAAEQ